ncbi:MAG: flagellar hook-basal body complex protein FliE [Dehalococcoidia bacterium]
MAINGIAALSPALTAATGAATPAAGGGGHDIGDLIANLRQTVLATSGMLVEAATGGNVDIHDVMIAVQAESLAFQVGLQVRNKAVEAYHEIFRMQV